MLRDDDVRDKKLTSYNEGMGNSYSTEYRFYDNRAGRWLSLDPLASKFPWSSPYVAMGNNPVIFTDVRGDSAFVFDNDLKYVNSIDNGKDNWEINVLHKNGNSTSTQVFNLNDPINDSERMKTLIEVYEGKNKQFLFYKSERDEVNYMRGSGLQEPLSKTSSIEGYLVQSFISSLFLANNSHWDGKSGVLDFWGKDLIVELVNKGLNPLSEKNNKGLLIGFFITGTKAYNDMDYGNRLWGKAAGYLRLPLWFVKFGANQDNKNHHNGENDDPADQRAIEDGWNSVK
ncbi:MAG TPA: hypothetical protein PLE30_10965 [Candidatus Kapabacteria bacterium]|nr:hypothetical protein [Candidatus Kapabacteria bacterium]